ncbi:MAG: hypothetical protein Q9214_006248, partial [Letrouitia sp. 1 TL-2023]
MAALHTALQSLGPTAFSSVPTKKNKTKEYLQDLFAQAQIILDSVPPPPPENNALSSRSRANTTTSEASNDSELSSSLARADPFNPSNISLQKEWGRPVKLTPKENPLGMAVYKLGGKDGRGAWFARRSVHEGLGFRKWKLGLQREFPETLEVQGKPGEGNIRGIGGERRVENVTVEGLGTIEVYHLSAQFPGPTTPRDFVTLLITSSSAIVDPGLSSAQQSTTTSEGGASESRSARVPRHFMVISKPCVHPDCPLREGFIRGQYESIEFIREIPIKPKKSSSAFDLLNQASNTKPQEQAPSIERAALVRNAHQKLDQGGSGDEMLDSMQITDHVPLAKNILIEEGRKRGKTISFAESRGYEAKGEAVDNLSETRLDDPAEQNPVEWIMVTRSDPGGSVPRFMVERGTPSGIVADAGKFVDWASKKDHPVKDDYGEKREGSEVELARSTSKNETLEAFQPNGYLAGSHD